MSLRGRAAGQAPRGGVARRSSSKIGLARHDATPMLTFQQVILKLQDYWGARGCALLQPYDMEVGAGTSHTATFLRALGREPWRAAYVQPSRRPKDGRYGENPNRLHQHHQFQVVLKPSPEDILDVFFQNEVEQSRYAFVASDVPKLFEQFAFFEGEAKRLLEAKLSLPGYEMILKAAHTFNLLDARGAISVTERAAYIGRIRTLSRLVAQAYVDSRETLGFPMLPPARETA